MELWNGVKVRIRHLIRSFHSWWNLGLCMFAGIRNRPGGNQPYAKRIKTFGGNKPYAKGI